MGWYAFTSGAIDCWPLQTYLLCGWLLWMFVGVQAYARYRRLQPKETTQVIDASWFVKQNSQDLQLILITIATLFLIGDIFKNHGFIAGDFVPSCRFFAGLYTVCYLFILYRLFRPDGHQDLLMFLFLVIGLPLGGYIWTVPTVALAVLVYVCRWQEETRMFAAVVFIPITQMIMGSLLFIYTPEYFSPLVLQKFLFAHPVPLCSVDGVYRLTSNGRTFVLYREVQILPGLYMRKFLEEKAGIRSDDASIRKGSDGKYEIVFAKREDPEVAKP
jgi:hypothetical protein